MSMIVAINKLFESCAPGGSSGAQLFFFNYTIMKICNEKPPRKGLIYFVYAWFLYKRLQKAREQAAYWCAVRNGLNAKCKGIHYNSDEDKLIEAHALYAKFSERVRALSTKTKQ